MLKATLVLYNNHTPNYFFKAPDTDLDDDWYISWRLLKDDLKKNGIILQNLGNRLVLFII